MNTTIIISVPSGSHHRALLQPMRELLLNKYTWNYVIVSPGAPWADQFFPSSEYPRHRFSFEEIKADAWDKPETAAKLEAIYKKYQPALVLTTTTGRDVVDRPILRVAKKLGLKTCTFIESWDNIWKMARLRSEQVMPDKILVWNQIMKEHLLREFSEIKDEQVAVTGAPRLDLFSHQNRIPSREELFEYIGLDPKKRLLHVATVELYDMSNVAEQIGLAKQDGSLPEDLQLYASMHPGSGKPAMHQHWADKYNYTLRYSFGRRDNSPHKDFNFNPTMREMYMLVALWKYTDVMVNFSSSAAVESMLGDRPTICVLYGKPLDWWNWRKSMVVKDFKEHYRDIVSGGGVRVIKKRPDLIPAINDCMEHPEKDRAGRVQSCQNIITFLDGSSCQRTMEEIQKLV
jgi:hypothetical protein